jgi:hypothetical protein
MWLTCPARLKIHVLITNQRLHRRLHAHVGDVEADDVGDVVDVEKVSAVVGNERVDEQHPRAEA